MKRFVVKSCGRCLRRVANAVMGFSNLIEDCADIIDPPDRSVVDLGAIRAFIDFEEQTAHRAVGALGRAARGKGDAA